VYSHKDARVLVFMKSNNLVSLYIPAGCTDTVFKVGLKAAFRDYLYGQHSIMTKRPEDNGTQSSLWAF
jgi:hypothetical protein